MGVWIAAVVPIVPKIFIKYHFVKNNFEADCISNATATMHLSYSPYA